MINLDEFNKKKYDSYNINNTPVKNNIACPKCGQEMYDSDPNIILDSFPPMMNIHCDCGYSDYRIC